MTLLIGAQGGPGRHAYLLAVAKPGQKHAFAITRPNTGVSFFEMARG